MELTPTTKGVPCARAANASLIVRYILIISCQAPEFRSTFKFRFFSVRRNSGAIVKTMGDAIMATFSLPQEGVNAAVEMINDMASLNAKLRAEDHELVLRIGLHEGSALAINADDRLDCFGQAVNISARVQGLAKSSEIWITEPIFLASRVRDVFNASGFRESEQSVILKVIREATTVYKMHRVVGE